VCRQGPDWQYICFFLYAALHPQLSTWLHQLASSTGTQNKPALLKDRELPAIIPKY